uniref:Protein sleepless n=1 Tax=Heliothis virescens TaxID=7102 RepID=A0A2A4K8T6_HELVI
MEKFLEHNRNNILIAIFITLCWSPTGHAIDCFKCVSMNGRFPACDDPFHNNHSLQMLESPCMGGRKGRDGLFPATSCIKIAGVFDDTRETITVRGCGLDSGTATTDTEIIRMSHCGRFYYDDRYVHGCLQSCNDADACNSSEIIRTKLPILIIIYHAFKLYTS